jgi:hypothetical protein
MRSNLNIYIFGMQEFEVSSNPAFQMLLQVLLIHICSYWSGTNCYLSDVGAVPVGRLAGAEAAPRVLEAEGVPPARRELGIHGEGVVVLGHAGPGWMPPTNQNRSCPSQKWCCRLQVDSSSACHQITALTGHEQKQIKLDCFLICIACTVSWTVLTVNLIFFC